MKTMSNVDIYTICYELNNLLQGARVDKSFQPTDDTIVTRFHIAGTGRVDLVFQAGVRIHTSQYPLENPTIPPSFPMILRKRLKGANVISIKQHHFDRVIEIKFKKEEIYTLIIELFSKGNIILLNEENEIIMPLKRKQWTSRDISAKKQYIYPPKHGINPIEISLDELKQLFKDSDLDLVKTLAMNGLGSLYAEEIVLKTNTYQKIDKKAKANELTNEEIANVYKAFKDIFKDLKNHKFKPMIIFKEKIVSNEYIEIDNSNNNSNRENTTLKTTKENIGNKDNIKSKSELDVVPINIEKYNEYNHKEYDSFNTACDEYFSKNINTNIKGIQENIWSKKVKKYSKRLDLQKEALEKFNKTIENSQKKGELLYSNYTLIENLLNVIKNARKKEYSWKEIAKILKDAKNQKMEEISIYEDMDKLGIVKLNILNTNIVIDSKLTVPENAELYYEKAKKAKRKIKGAEVAIKNTKKQLKEMEDKKELAMGKVKVPQKRVKKELKWFEKLRWFITSDDTLVIGGRDTNTNETVVKKYLEKNDIYLHADIHGAPSVVIKLDKNEINNNILKESAIFAASFSTAWSKNYTTQDVFWVNSQQVSKSPEHGEFLQKGAFVIRGEKRFIRGARLQLGVGIVDYEGKRIMIGPVDSIKKHTNNYVIIKPGYMKKEAISKKILSILKDKENIIKIDDIVRVLPPGKCDIDESAMENKRFQKKHPYIKN